MVLVEDHALFSQSLLLVLRAEGATVHAVDPLEPDVVLAQCSGHRAQLVLLDLDLGKITGDGVALVAPLVAIGAQVIVLTGSTDEARLGSCLEAGAIGVIAKTSPLDALLDQLRRASRGQDIMPVQRRHDLVLQARLQRDECRRLMLGFDALTEREGEVLAALVRGSQVDDVTRELFVTETTARTHVRAILRKLDVRSQLGAVARAHDAGWKLPAQRQPQH